MCKFDKRGSAARLPALRAGLMATVLAAGLHAPLAARAGLVEDDKTASADPSRTKAAPGYLLRCWQEGKLIVEEYLIELPPSVDLTAAKLKALDTDRHAVYVTETRNATCLLRARAPERKGATGW
jgi:hypothetical protein